MVFKFPTPQEGTLRGNIVLESGVPFVLIDDSKRVPINCTCRNWPQNMVRTHGIFHSKIGNHPLVVETVSCVDPIDKVIVFEKSVKEYIFPLSAGFPV